MTFLLLCVGFNGMSFITYLLITIEKN